MYGRPSHPLPHRQLMIDFLDLYPEYRKDSRKSLLNTAKYAYEKLTSYITYKPPVDDELDGMVKKRREDMEDASSFEDWYRLIFKLRKNAEKAQTLKKFGGDESVLRHTFHGCANLIIHELEQCEFDPLIEEYKLYRNVLAKKIAELKDRAEIIKREIDANSKSGKTNNKTNADFNKIVLDLAWLGVEEFVNIAMQHRLLPTLNVPQENEIKELKLASMPVNMSVPIVLHRQHSEWYYRFKFQSLETTKISFSEFKTRGIARAEEQKLKEGNIKIPTPEKHQENTAAQPIGNAVSNTTPDKPTPNNQTGNKTPDKPTLNNQSGNVTNLTASLDLSTSKGNTSSQTLITGSGNIKLTMPEKPKELAGSNTIDTQLNMTTSSELCISKGNATQNPITLTDCKDSFFNNAGNTNNTVNKDPTDNPVLQKLPTPT